MKTLTFNMICTLLFGIERGERRQTLVRLFEQVMDAMVAVPLNLPFTRFNKSIRARAEAGAIVRALIREKRQKLERGEAEHDLITSLLSMCDDTDSPLLSYQEIEDNCAVAIIAGHDTTSTLLTYLIKLIAEHPNVYQVLLNGTLVVCLWELSNLKYVFLLYFSLFIFCWRARRDCTREKGSE